ncbi:SRR1-like protein isoform X1 [Scyliorhinus canicula]|uniref:SRR1-like protein isoform X1 n=1 Tax=Scyliorhinus canicula TaxID=7830 RepID=UPI0018F484DB|nr:SRR1-like protein isoform X1 [Scyliorhinus canicula]
MSACPAEGEWKTIRKKKGVKKRKDNIRGIHQREAEFLSVTEGERVQQKIKEAVEELRSSEFWTDCLEIIQRVVNVYYTAPLASPSIPFFGGEAPESLEDKKNNVCHCRTTLDLVCYGIGNFSSSITSRYQLALLFLLLETLQIPRDGCRFFDPLFTEWEKTFLKDCGMVVLKENEEGKRSIDKPTLFYMIHCGKALYNNLLWKNWSPQKLAQTILIGNSFKGMEERLPARVLQRDYTYINHILTITEEAAFPCSSRYMDVFNDTAIHQFPRKNLEAKPTEFWEGAAEPTYQECEDLEVIQKGIECFSVS